MAVFVLYIKEKGTGCDYTIGCGSVFHLLEGQNSTAALEETRELLDEYYSLLDVHDSYDARGVDEARLFRVEREFTVPHQGWLLPIWGSGVDGLWSRRALESEEGES